MLIRRTAPLSSIVWSVTVSETGIVMSSFRPSVYCTDTV